MARRTPGPWKLYSAPLRAQFPVPILEIQDAKDEPVVAWPGFDGLRRPKGEITANARLMAAAPELLAALKQPIVMYALGYISEFAGDGGDHTEADGRKADRARKAIRAAIDQAEGRQVSAPSTRSRQP